MKRITVVRGDGLAVAEDIVLTLASNENVMLQHGRNFIDAQEQKRDVRMDVAYRGDYMKGQLCQVVDTMDGVTWRGQIQGVEHRFSKAKLITALNVERFL